MYCSVTVPDEVNPSVHNMWSIGMLLVACVSGYSIIESDDAVEGVIWPSEYYLKGSKLDLSVGIELPFEIWYSAELNRSRISFYGRLDSTYYYSETDDTDGHEYKVYPMTKSGLDEIEKCSEESYEGDAEDFLPTIKNFKYSGQKLYNNRIVSVWKSFKSDENNTEEEILYVYRDDGYDFDLPVRYETKSYNEWIKAMSGHTIIEYHNFKYPDSADLDVANVESCENANIGTDLKKALNFYHPDTSSGLNKAFHAYKHHHNRHYRDAEHERRKRIFQQNWRQVISHNQKNLSYKMAINRFSDRTPEELKYLTATSPNPFGKGSVAFPHSEEELKALVEDLPENYNMRIDGVIGNVKNQGNCGSCWAFATTAAVEGALARSNGGRNLDLSEQSLVDCAWEFGNMGCDGGLLDYALNYVLKHGIPTEREYGSYLEKNGNCTERDMKEVYTIKGFARIPPLGVNAMKVALFKYGPVAVCIHATDDMTKYSSGIFYDAQCEGKKHINHGVTAVGYGVRDGTLYWIVKNSWGEDWGQDGYILMSATNDNCLLLTEAYYPIV